MSLSAPATSAGLGGAGGGQGAQIIQQIQGLLAQLVQTESNPAVQRAAQSIMQVLDPMMQAVSGSDTQNMSSGLANPGGDTEPDADDMGGAGESSDQGGGSTPKSFGGARKAAMANFSSKGHFSKSGSKGEPPQTNKTKNRLKGR